MPIRRGRNYYQYGKDGHKYHYIVGNTKSRNMARRKAMKQGQAIEISKHGGIGNPFKYVKEKVKKEYDKFKKNPIGYLTPEKYQYCGPYTNLDDDRKPVNATDATCKTHDYDYDSIQKRKEKGEITKEESKKLVREADDRMLDSLSKVKNKSISDRLVEYAIKSKKKLENIGLLDPNKFVGGIFYHPLV